MFSFILWTVLLPIAITAAMQLAIVRVGPRCGQGDYASALAISLTFLLGLCWLDRWEFPPTRHWHWTGYAGVASAGVAVASCCLGVWWFRLGSILVAIATAYVVVPTWDSLVPPRVWLVMIFAAYLWMLQHLYAALCRRVPRDLVMLFCAVTLAIVAATIGYQISLRYGALAALAAAVVLGSTLAGRGTPQADGTVVGGVIAIVAGCVTFVGAVEPEPALYAMGWLPLLPLAAVFFASQARGDEARGDEARGDPARRTDAK